MRLHRPEVLYADLMSELKVRLLWIDYTLSSETGLHGQVAEEFCFLQLRFAAELVAIGSLVAHGDIEVAQSAKLQKAYEADRILNALDEVHPDFYPRPVVHMMLGPRRHHFDWFQGPALSRADLVNLWRRCGGILHKGSLKRLASPDQRTEIDRAEIEKAVLHLRNLLSTHAIRGLDERNYSICLMHFGSNQPPEFVRATSHA
jgi:hypothetical protein